MVLTASQVSLYQHTIPLLGHSSVLLYVIPHSSVNTRLFRLEIYYLHKLTGRKIHISIRKPKGL